MPAYEIALPPGAKNIKIKTATQEIPVEPTFYRNSKDGAIPIVALFAGDNFIGEVLEGQWLKDKGNIQGFVAKINNGSLELSGKSEADGTWNAAWITSKCKIPIIDECVVDVHLKVPSSISSEDVVLIFALSVEEGGSPEGRGNNINVDLRVATTTFMIRVRKRVNGSETVLLPLTTVNNNEGTFRFKFEPDDGHFHLYYHDGSGSVNEATDELDGSPFTLDSVFQNALMCPSFQLATDYATLSTVSSDFVRVTYPNFSVRYDLDDDAFQGEGEELLKKAWDTSGNGNHSVVYGATWVRDGKFGKALSFDGEDDYLDIPVNEKLQLKTFTICIWTKILSWNRSYQMIFDLEYEIGKGLVRIQRNADAQRLQLALKDTTDNWHFAYTPNLNLNEWYFITVTFTDGNTGKLYLDASLVDETDSLNLHDYVEPILRLGNGFAGEAGNEIIGKLLIYERILSESEIQTLNNGGSVTDGLVGEWKFDGGNNRGEVIVWDTMGSDNEDDWVRVFDSSHKFVGDCVIENGLIRMKIADNRLKLFLWNGEWKDYGDYVRTYMHDLCTFEGIEFISLDKVVIKTRWKTASGSYTDRIFRLTVFRGKPFAEFEMIEPENGDYDERRFHIRSTPRFVYCCEEIADDVLDNTFVYPTPPENFVSSIGVSEQTLLTLANTKQRKMEGDMYGDPVLYYGYHEKIFLGVTPFSKAGNLFMEAEA